MKRETSMIKNIKLRRIGLLLATILLTSMLTAGYSQNRGEVVNRTLCPRYSIVNDEIAYKMDSVYSLMDSMGSVCLQGYMYYKFNETEVYNNNKLYYYLEVVKQYHSCEPLTKAVVSNKKGFPFLLLEEEEVKSGCFKYEGDSVWVEYYYNQLDIQPDGSCNITTEDADSVIAWHQFPFSLWQDIDSLWLNKDLRRIFDVKL